MYRSSSSPMRCISPTSAKWRVELDMNIKSDLHNVDLGTKSTVYRSADEQNRGFFEPLAPRFARDPSPKHRAGEMGPDPYLLNRQNPWQSDSKNAFNFNATTESRFHESKPKPCTHNGLDPYRTKNNNMWIHKNQQMGWKKERYNGLENTR
mmetsp:Transcript_15495/g.21385  ORF Transcript_15495/g.21385 Transcript_15495/m.21385 type:complete len:151 (-) Transcript_15495:90-542(-)|eukprot:CAMPEP_0196586652 /NCGR_PEP_ID=MMETSP1081-20130531/55089_1 /TAXON_ID=36882 /ORGANISM="Pyramimonas amylifera, Strain CCMP720" /LENGTH=150 /DNA_ID=CAMNT_0041908605 /DNA_START=130 /DNA_END=582 /DNA_ORIENTATION=+